MLEVKISSKKLKLETQTQGEVVEIEIDRPAASDGGGEKTGKYIPYLLRLSFNFLINTHNRETHTKNNGDGNCLRPWIKND